MTDMDIIERLDGPHEWGYRGLTGEGFIHDPAPNNAAREIQKLRAENERLRAALERIANFEPQDWTTRHASAALRIVPPPQTAATDEEKGDG